MSETPPILEKALNALGLSTTQIRWRWYRQRDAARDYFKAMRQARAKHKFCHHCGQIAAVTDRRCPNCQRVLLPYWASRACRTLALGGLGRVVSKTFIGLVTLLFSLQLALTHFHSLLSPSGEALVLFGAFSTELFNLGEYWRAMTMGLEHIGIIHLVFNLMAISQVLSAFEDEIGSWATLVLITLTQIGTIAVHVLVNPPGTLTAGASGIAFGLIGFGVAYAHRRGNRMQRRFFLQWFAYGIIFGFLVGANNAAHLGGFLTGLPLGLLAAGMRRRHVAFWRVAGILCLALWLASLGFLARNLVLNHGALDTTSTMAG